MPEVPPSCDVGEPQPQQKLLQGLNMPRPKMQNSRLLNSQTLASPQVRGAKPQPQKAPKICNSEPHVGTETPIEHIEQDNRPRRNNRSAFTGTIGKRERERETTQRSDARRLRLIVRLGLSSSLAPGSFWGLIIIVITITSTSTITITITILQDNRSARGVGGSKVFVSRDSVLWASGLRGCMGVGGCVGFGGFGV